MKSIKGLIIFSAILGLVAAGWAEGEVKGTAGKQGIRVAIRNAPGIDKVETSGYNNIGTVTGDPSDGVQVDVMYAKRFMGKDGNNTVGPIAAAGLFVSNSSGKTATGVEAELTTFGAIVEGGVAVQLGRVAVLEVAPFLGLGASNQSVTIPGTVTVEDGSGPYIQYGIKGGVFFQIASNIELGLEAGYVGFSSDGSLDWVGGGTTDLTFSGGGFQGAGVFVIKF